MFTLAGLKYWYPCNVSIASHLTLDLHTPPHYAKIQRSHPSFPPFIHSSPPHHRIATTEPSLTLHRFPPNILRRRLDYAMQQHMAKIRTDNEEDDNVDCDCVEHDDDAKKSPRFVNRIEMILLKTKVDRHGCLRGRT
jgi:hypothetical protein